MYGLKGQLCKVWCGLAIERKLEAIAPVSFTIDGGSNGLVTISSTENFKVKASVVISATSLPTLTLEVKRVLSATTMLVGPAGNINARSDLSIYTIASNPTVFQPEQDRPGIPFEQHERATYEEEPIMAKRVVIVDKLGNKITTNDDGSISGLDVNVINKLLNVPHDDIEIMARNENGDPLTIAVRNLGVQLFSLSLTYDYSGDLQRVRRV